MHYVGILAFALLVNILYDLSTVIVSLLAAIAASAIALFVASCQVVSALNLIWDSIFMGSGILAMHYIGMAAATFSPMSGTVDYSHAVSASALDITGIVIVTSCFSASRCSAPALISD